MIAGIQLDTDFLSRRVSRTDLDAHSDLFFLGNNALAREVVRTALRLDQLPDIGKAFSSTAVDGEVIVAELEGDYSSELLSVLADFLLRLREITFAVVIETGGNECRAFRPDTRRGSRRRLHSLESALRNRIGRRTPAHGRRD